LQPQHDGRVRGSARLGIIPVSFILFPSPPGKVKTHRRTDEANPCQRRRFCEQPTGKSGIDNCSAKEDIPRNLAFFFRRCVGWRCHSSAPMRLVKPNYVLSGSVEQASCLGMLDKTLSNSCQDWDFSPSDFFEVLFHISSMRGLNIVSHKTPPFQWRHRPSAGLRTPRGRD